MQNLDVFRNATNKTLHLINMKTVHNNFLINFLARKSLVFYDFRLRKLLRQTKNTSTWSETKTPRSNIYDRIYF